MLTILAPWTTDFQVRLEVAQTKRALSVHPDRPRTHARTAGIDAPIRPTDRSLALPTPRQTSIIISPKALRSIQELGP